MISKFSNHLLLLFCLGYVSTFIHLPDQELFEGDACRVTRSDTWGTCKSVLNCESAIVDLHELERPDHCAWNGSTERICYRIPPTPISIRTESSRISVKSECRLRFFFFFISHRIEIMNAVIFIFFQNAICMRECCMI